jgi:hypothetical protein
VEASLSDVVTNAGNVRRIRLGCCTCASGKEGESEQKRDLQTLPNLHATRIIICTDKIGDVNFITDVTTHKVLPVDWLHLFVEFIVKSDIIFSCH